MFSISAANESLGGERLLLCWRFANEGRGLVNADVLIKIRNLWRFAISVDNRYGPIYNQNCHCDHRPDECSVFNPTQRQPFKIILIGTSGGAQVALAAAPHLDEWLDAQITVLSWGVLQRWLQCG